jgi:FixJ family two-component response regulator
MSGTCTVFLVDDDPGVLKALTRLLRAWGYEVRAFASATEFLREHDASLPGCLVLDVSMPDWDGLELLQRITASGADRPAVFITGHGDIPTSVRAMKAGAVDFLTKPFEEGHLLSAVRAAIEKDALVRRARAEQRSIEQRLSTLTPREREVLEHLVIGQLNKHIAAELGIVEKTIKVHRGRIMHKMRAVSLVELVRMADTAGVRPSFASATGH